MQCRALRFRRVTATHRRPTRRPARARWMRKVRLARSERTNETRVPVAILASTAGPRRAAWNARGDTRSDETVGLTTAPVPAPDGVDGVVPVVPLVEPPEDADPTGPGAGVTWSVCEVEPTPFALSVTVSVTVKAVVTPVLYVCWIVAPEPVAPSPKSHW